MQKLGYIISGTCGGFQNDFIRYSSWLDIDKITLVDLRNNDDKDTKGKQCYAISLQCENNVISKIEIIKDGYRSKSTGFVSFNLIIPSGFYIDEESIVSILDEGLGIYTDEFVKDNVLEDERHVSNFDKEIEQLLSKVNLKPRVTFKWLKGIKDAGFLFIPSNKISEYFKYENIFQEEYKGYREIYLIDPSERKENPSSILNALKHDPNADLTNKIDLDNPYYTITTKIAESITLKGINNGLKVKLKDKVVFGFSKNFHNTEAPNYSGSWKELLDCYPNVISKSHEIPNTIVIKSPRFEPELKKITIKFKDTSDNKIIIPNFLEYKIKSGDKTKRISNDQIELIGDEIGLKWEIKVNKNDKYKASSGHLLNPIFKTSKTISLDPVSRPFNWKPVIIGIFSIVIFGGIGYLGYWGYNSLFTEKDEDHKEVIKITSIDNDQIRAYIQGNELNIDSLESLKNLSSDSLLSIQLNDLIRFRMSLNTIYRDSIQVLYNSFDKLSIAHDKNKKKLLASILDSISFSDDYKTIANREVMAFYEIEDTINSIIRSKSQTSQTEEVITQSNEAERILTTETDVSEQQTSTNNVSQDSEVKKSKYTEKEFLEKIINGQELDSSKMTDLMQNIVNLKKQKNISDKAFKDIVTSESENLARIEKKLKNSN